MPNRTTSPPRPASPVPPLSRASAAAAPLIAAASFAAVELAAALLLTRFFEWGRAESLLFLAFRPWLLAAAAVLVGRWSISRRLSFYAASLLLAAGCEAVLLVALGARDPWPELLRGLAAGAAVALIADFAIQALRRWRPRLGPALAGLGLAASFAAGALRPYEALVLARTAPRDAAPAGPPLLLMTGLPIVWGSGGAFDPASRPSEAYRLLEREFDVLPIDAIEPEALAGARLMLLAQPRLLAPEELAALDDWVRRGGRLLVLTDPRLSWASELPPGDVRRPPASGLLDPLLSHWGVRLEADARPIFVDFPRSESIVRRLVLLTPGRFTLHGPTCRLGPAAYVARCRIGRGAALLVADADLLDDRIWAPAGSERHRRTADNPLVVADWLDGLAGVRRARQDLPVAWIGPEEYPTRALLLAALPLLLVLASGLGLLYRGRSIPTNISTVASTVNNSRTTTPRNT